MTGQVAGVYHRRIGDILVTALHDGHQDVAMATVLGLPQDESTAMLRAAFRPARRTAVNAFLLRQGGRTALIDAGCGPSRPTVGFLRANLRAAGVAPEQVDTVLMTHLHPDHWGGLSDEAGRALFPRAELMLHEAERDYWFDDAAMARVEDPARRELFFLGARRGLAPYADRTRTFTAGEVLPGVTAIPLPGHTPGHTGFMIAWGARSLLIWGDIIHVQELQVPRPEVVMAVDVNPAQAAVTRHRLLDQVATSRRAIAGMQIHFPPFAHVAKEVEGYRLVPDAWTVDLDGDAPCPG